MRTIKDIRVLCTEERYDEALDLLDKNEVETATTLVWKAIVTQLGETRYSLEDAHRFLMEAVDREPTNAEALFELGAFLQNVADDGEAALPYYERAIDSLGARLTELLAGALSCVGEKGEDGGVYLEQVARKLIDVQAIKEQIG